MDVVNRGYGWWWEPRGNGRRARLNVNHDQALTSSRYLAPISLARSLRRCTPLQELPTRASLPVAMRRPHASLNASLDLHVLWHGKFNFRESWRGHGYTHRRRRRACMGLIGLERTERRGRKVEIGS